MIKKLIALLFIIAVALLLDFYFFLQKPLGLDQSISYHFKPGSSVSALARDLEQQQIISNRLYFSILTRLTGSAKQLHAGEYELTPGMTVWQLHELLKKGKVRLYSLTLVEGFNFRQMMQAVHASEYLDHQLKGLSDQQIMQKIGYPDEHPEGRFFPDTYHFPRGTSDIRLLRQAYAEMQKRLERAWQQRDVGLPIKNAYELLTLASIVEKESAVAEERGIIAGVFVNRLRMGMRLQTDPTVIYGIGVDYDGDIRFRDLRRDTPYNTYTRHGLPPTPIAMPGQGALDAASRPEDTDYIYFVATSDQSGRHIFSTTLAEHERAVDIHQRKIKRN